MATLQSLAERLGELDDDLPVVFGGAIYETYPATLKKGDLLAPAYYTSYRGFYSCPALVPQERLVAGLPDVGWLQKLTEDTVGETFAGWKGGDYEMEASKPVFVAVEGDATNVGILDVVVSDGRAILVTYNVEEYVFT